MDPLIPAVRWFDHEGNYLGGVEAAGSGPGEVRNPWAIAVSGNELAIVDPPNRRMSVYDLSSDEVRLKNEIVQAWSNLGGTRNVCGSEGRWYAHYVAAGGLIHVLASTGEVLRSFEDAAEVSVDEYGPMAFMAAPHLNARQLACVEDEEIVVSWGPNGQALSAYRSDGTLVWRKVIDDLRPGRLVVRRNANGAVGLSVDAAPEGWHQGVSAVSWNEESILVQYRLVYAATEEPANQQVDSIVSILVSLETGEELGRTTELPAISDVWGDFVYSYQNEPFPRVIIFRKRTG
jgi:hypothetical protein